MREIFLHLILQQNLAVRELIILLHPTFPWMPTHIGVWWCFILHTIYCIVPRKKQPSWRSCFHLTKSTEMEIIYRFMTF